MWSSFANKHRRSNFADQREFGRQWPNESITLRVGCICSIRIDTACRGARLVRWKRRSCINSGQCCKGPRTRPWSFQYSCQHTAAKPESKLSEKVGASGKQRGPGQAQKMKRTLLLAMLPLADSARRCGGPRTRPSCGFRLARSDHYPGWIGLSLNIFEARQATVGGTDAT